MRNTIIFDLDNFEMLCLAQVNNDTNAIALQATKEDFNNPYIQFILADGSTVNTDDLEVNDDQIEYEIPEEYYNLTGNITAQFRDGSYTSDIITITGVEIENGYSLTVLSNTDQEYYCKSSYPAGGSDFNNEWKTIINANAAARHEHSNKSILDELDEPLTNEEIEALLT